MCPWECRGSSKRGKSKHKPEIVEGAPLPLVIKPKILVALRSLTGTKNDNTSRHVMQHKAAYLHSG